MLEKDFWNNVAHPPLKKAGEFERVENAQGVGTADVSYAMNGVQGWIETKVEKGGHLYFEKFQIPWLLRRRSHAEHIYVLAYFPKTSAVVLYDPQQLMWAEREVHGKWTRVRAQDLPDIMTLSRPYAWHKLIEKLSQS